VIIQMKTKKNGILMKLYYTQKFVNEKEKTKQNKYKEENEVHKEKRKNVLFLCQLIFFFLFACFCVVCFNEKKKISSEKKKKRILMKKNKIYLSIEKRKTKLFSVSIYF